MHFATVYIKTMFAETWCLEELCALISVAFTFRKYVRKIPFVFSLFWWAAIQVMEQFFLYTNRCHRDILPSLWILQTLKWLNNNVISDSKENATFFFFSHSFLTFCFNVMIKSLPHVAYKSPQIKKKCNMYEILFKLLKRQLISYIFNMNIFAKIQISKVFYYL